MLAFGWGIQVTLASLRAWHLQGVPRADIIVENMGFNIISQALEI